MGQLLKLKRAQCTFNLESTHFILNECHIYSHDGASDKFSTNSVAHTKRITVQGTAKPPEFCKHAASTMM
jgi:hypothetical protein